MHALNGNLGRKYNARLIGLKQQTQLFITVMHQAIYKFKTAITMI